MRRGRCPGYLVGVVLVDDADVLAVREPEEAEVFGFFQVAVQVVKNLSEAGRRSRDCTGHRMTVGMLGARAHHQKKIPELVLTLPNSTECWPLTISTYRWTSFSNLENKNDLSFVLA